VNKRWFSTGRVLVAASPRLRLCLEARYGVRGEVWVLGCAGGRVVGGAKKSDLTRHHPAEAQLRAPLLAIGAYAALSPGQQGRRAKGPRAQEPRV